MTNKPVLPIPFLILILAGIVSLFSILADRSSKAGVVRHDSLQIQTVEQERMAAIYFRILSWLSELTPRASAPAKINPQPSPAPPNIKVRRRQQGPGRVEFCAFHSWRNPAAEPHRAHNLN